MVENRVCCITGGSRGIGRELVTAFSNAGYRIVFTYRNDSSKELAKQLCVDNRIYAVQCDSSTTDGAQCLLDTVINSFGKVDVLINNAGVSLYKLLQDTTLQEIDYVMKNNLYSAIENSKVFTNYFLSAGHGNIINSSSVWGKVGSAFESVYSASKAGIIALTQAHAKEVASSNIIVNCIASGAVNTEMLSTLSSSDIDELVKEIPLNRLAMPNDIAKLALFLANSTYMTGQTIVIDGGLSL